MLTGDFLQHLIPTQMQSIQATTGEFPTTFRAPALLAVGGVVGINRDPGDGYLCLSNRQCR